MLIIDEQIDQLKLESGFHFVKTKDSKFWQCIAEIKGKAPFLRVGKVIPIFKNSDSVDILESEPTDLIWSIDINLSDTSFSSLSTLDKTVINLMKDGRKLQAVKLYKDETGLGLRESKDYCDNLQAKYIR